MRGLLAGIRRWWLRRCRGIVEPPAQAKGHGTTWQQHPGIASLYAGWTQGFVCKCGKPLSFEVADLKIISQEHKDGCDGVFQHAVSTCACPITEARYVKICPQCHLGHWKQAK